MGSFVDAVSWLLDQGHALSDWMLAWSESAWAPVALFVFSFWESSFFPIPPDPLLIAMGVGKPEFALLFAAICTTGSILGAAFGYYIGKRGGRPLALRIFKEEKIRVAEAMYRRYDVWAVGAAAFTPLPYKVFTITAGIADLHFGRFMLASLLGRAGRFFLVGLLITFFGASIRRAIDEYFNYFTVAFLVLLVVGFIVIKYGGRYLARRERGMIQQTDAPALD
ncbi:MAG TPA: YqaA family protein [Thermomicrobiales bacterium]|nr:YqaA family protein [Thermomicrobiales bacterium]